MPQDIREQEPEQSHVFSWLSAAWRFPSVDEVLLLARVDVSLIRGTSPRAETLPPPIQPPTEARCHSQVLCHRCPLLDQRWPAHRSGERSSMGLWKDS